MPLWTPLADLSAVLRQYDEFAFEWFVMSNSDAIERRRAIAARAAERYAANPAVAAVLVAGSVARGLADELSDIELDVYWRRPPTDDERMAVVEGAGWKRVYAEVDEHEWADGYKIDGVKLDTSGFLVSTIDAYLSAALDHADTEPELQVRITALLHGQTLHGRGEIDQWRDRCSRYQDKLALAMVAKGLALPPRERLDMLVARDDVLVLHRDLLGVVQGLLDALFGLNRVFIPHPYHKWLAWEAGLILIKPNDLVRRIRSLLVAPPRPAVDEACALADEVFDLVAAHLPQSVIAPARQAFAFRRTA
jgi:predicted nucleotidyltransferase